MAELRVPNSLPRTLLGVLSVGVLIAASLWVLRPFLPALIWATMVVVTSWPLMTRIQARLWGKRGLAVAAMTVALLLLLLVPLSLGIYALVNEAGRLADLAPTLANLTIPAPPAWVTRLPLVGPKVVAKWETIAAMPAADLAAALTPYVQQVLRWLVARIGSFGGTLLQFVLVVILAAILFASGEQVANGLRRFAGWMAGEQGEQAVILAGGAIRGVALGVIVTAIVQSIVSGAGLMVTGVPSPVILTALIFILSIAQVGPLPVLAGAIAYLYWRGNAGWGTVLVIWSIPCVTLDNVLRPILIRRGANLPLLLIFAGVIGGLIAFGVIGIFIGPLTLAVTFTLLKAWVAEGRAGSSATP
jgi:predicted PurR-regulated permease PerM